jgi:hypothetical protein
MTTVLTPKEVVCPTCYLAAHLILSSEPRMPSPGMLWYCRECHEISCFDENLDLRLASDAEKAKAIKPENLPR